jgi:transposase
MSVYVGMDVHRKRSQVAIVDEDGVQQRNRNLANDPAKLVPILGGLPPGTPVALEAAYGWGWLVELLEELEPHLVHPSRCKAIAAARTGERQGRRGHPGAAAARRPAAGGLDRAPAGP